MKLLKVLTIMCKDVLIHGFGWYSNLGFLRSATVSAQNLGLMREDERNGNWFAVESKSFKFTMEGEGKKAKCFITERSRGIASWIRFGVEGMNKLLEGVEECCRVSVSARRPLEWWENGRYFRLERKENNAGRFILCSVNDAEGKKHRLVFPEGRGFVNGWTMLAEKIRGLGFKALQENKPMRNVTEVLSKGEEKKWTSPSKNKVTWGGQHRFKVEEVAGSSVDSAVWMDVGDFVFGKGLGPLQFCLIGKWKTKPNPYPTAKVMEVWFREAWRINGEVRIAALNEDLFLLEFDVPEKAKWVLVSGIRSFKGGTLQFEWWSPESGCLRRKDLGREVWIRVVGLPLHLWTPEILRKLGDACGGFVAVDKNTELKTEVKWARMLVRMVGKSRPSVVNILEGPRSFEMQIWWEVSPWVSGVYPIGARSDAEILEVEEEAEARAGKGVEICWQKSNDEDQSLQGCKTKLGKKKGHAEADVVCSAPGEVQNGRVGAKAEKRGNKTVGYCAKGEGLSQQVRSSGGPDVRACFLPGLKRNESYGPRDIITRRLAVLKNGNGLGVGLHLQLDKDRKSANGGDAGKKGLLGLEVPRLSQAGKSNWNRDLRKSRRGNWGLIKVAQSGTAGSTSDSREEWRTKVGGSRSGAGGSCEALVDPAWICVRGPLLQTKERWPGWGDTPRFESCWEKGWSLVVVESLATGGSGHGNGDEGFSVGSSVALAEAVAMRTEVVDPKAFGTSAEGPRFVPLPPVDASLSPSSVFSRPLLSGDSSGAGDFCEHDSLGDMEPLRVVSGDGREWGKGTTYDSTIEGKDPRGHGFLKGESASGQPQCTGYNNWEDSCLFKFSEYLGVTTAGFEEEILKLMRKIEVQQAGDKRKGSATETRCERELRKLECTIDYSGKN